MKLNLEKRQGIQQGGYNMTEQMMTKYDTTHEQEFDVTLTQDQYDFISRLIDE